DIPHGGEVCANGLHLLAPVARRDDVAASLESIRSLTLGDAAGDGIEARASGAFDLRYLRLLRGVVGSQRPNGANRLRDRRGGGAVLLEVARIAGDDESALCGLRLGQR